jgi:hypothetical protein
MQSIQICFDPVRASFSAGTRMANVVTPPISATCMPTPIRNVIVSVADPVPDLHPPMAPIVCLYALLFCFDVVVCV